MKSRIVALLSTLVFLMAQWPTYLLLGVQEYKLMDNSVVLHGLDRGFHPTHQQAICENGLDCMQKMCTMYKDDPNTSLVAFNPLRKMSDLSTCNFDMTHLNGEHPQFAFMFFCIVAMTLLSAFHTILLFSKNRLLMVKRDKACLTLLCAWIGALFVALSLFEAMVFIESSIPLQVVLPTFICQVLTTCLTTTIIVMYWANGYHTSIYEILRD